MKTFELIEVIWKEAYGDTPVKIRKENFDPEKHTMVGGEKGPATSEEPDAPPEKPPRRK